MATPRTNAGKDQNFESTLLAVSSTDGTTPVALEADPTTGALLISGGTGGGGGTQYTDGAAAAAHPIGTQQVFTGAGGTVVAVSSSNPLPITGSISVGSTADQSTFTAGTSTTGPVAGVFNDSVTALTSGQQGTIRSTTNRAIHTNLRNNSGTEIGTSITPVRIDPTGTTTQPVSAASLPLPSGAATSANQTTELSSLASIATNTGTKADTFVTGTITAADAVVAAPTGSGTPLSGASTAGSIVAIASPGGASAWVASITGTLSGTYYFEISINSTNGTDGTWINVNGRQTGLVSTTTVADYKTTLTGEFRGSPAGSKYFRVRNVGGSGLNTTITIGMTTGTGPVFLYSSIPNGTNNIGNVKLVDTAGTNQASISAAGALKVDNSGVTQPISAASLPLPTGAALDATLTGGTAQSKLTDGTNIATVKAASTAAVATDKALVVAISPNNPISVSGTSDGSAAISITANATSSGQLASLNSVATGTVQLTGTWVGTVQVQLQADGSTWTNVTGSNVITNSATGAYVASGNLTANGIYQLDIGGMNGIRVITTAFTSGTITGSVRASTGAGSVSIDGTPSVSVTSSVGVGTTSATRPGTAMYIGGGNSSGQLIGISVADNQLDSSSGGTYLSVSPNIYNGASYDRHRSATSASGTTGTGVPAAGILGHDGTNYQRIKADTVGVLQVSAQASTTSTGMSIFSNQALTNTVTSVKSSAVTRMYEFDFYNPNTTAVWVQLFNVALPGSVTLGTTAPTRTIYIPASSGRDYSSSISAGWSAGLQIACTTTNTGNTAPTTAIQAYVGYL